MNSSQQIWKRIPERMAALFCLMVLLPTLLCIAALIGLSAGGPVLSVDSVALNNGTFVQKRRFRTTGSKVRSFRFLTRVLRQYQLDEFPALWDVVCGRIRWKDVFRH